MIQKKKIEQVEDFWNDNLCGSHFIDKEKFSEQFYTEYRAYRYKKEHHIPPIIEAMNTSNKDVLEIGLGVGADATLWAKQSKSFTGIDLTDEAVYATKKHLEILGLKGNIVKGSAESLPFEDNSFDVVSSHGVLHHTTSIENTFKEIQRVLKPGGSFVVMLYTKDSFNYWVRIQLYFRLRVLFEFFKTKLGSQPKGWWKEHIENINQKGWSYLSWKEFPHHCTDGPNCDIANIYYKKEIIHLLKQYDLIVKSSKKYHFPIMKNFPKTELLLSNYFGFFRFYWGKKKG